MLPNGRAILSAGSGSNASATNPNKWYRRHHRARYLRLQDDHGPLRRLCSITSNLPNGNVLSAGGNAYETPERYYTGEPSSAVFDWQTETWAR